MFQGYEYHSVHSSLSFGGLPGQFNANASRCEKQKMSSEIPIRSNANQALQPRLEISGLESSVIIHKRQRRTNALSDQAAQ